MFYGKKEKLHSDSIKKNIEADVGSTLLMNDSQDPTVAGLPQALPDVPRLRSA